MKNINVLLLSTVVAISKVSACLPDCWAEPLGYPCCTAYEPQVVSVDEHGEWGEENGKKCGILVIDHSVRCAPPPRPEIESCDNSLCKYVLNVDEGTIWGYDSNIKQRCYMNTEDASCVNDIKSTCWSALLGYKCCTKPETLYKDKDGIWSVEDGNWCGIETCPSCVPVDSVDRYGNIWGFDKNTNKKCIINKDQCNAEIAKDCRSALNGYMCCRNSTTVYAEDSFGAWGVENGKWCGFN